MKKFGTMQHILDSKNNLFHWYIKRWKSQNPSVGLPSLFDVLKVYILIEVSKIRQA